MKSAAARVCACVCVCVCIQEGVEEEHAAHRKQTEHSSKVIDIGNLIHMTTAMTPVKSSSYSCPYVHKSGTIYCFCTEIPKKCTFTQIWL